MADAVRCNGLTDLDEKCVDTIRFLSADGVQKANSGHPGMPIAMAPVAYTLWTKYMKFNPANPRWVNRDRFVLSAGHGSILLYSMLHLTGFDMPMDELKNFRQWDSKTPGHPEYEPDLGVEVTTGPLGQGIANAVGMAIAQKHLAAVFNRDSFDMIDYKIYVLSGDGCLEEGVSGEASSLAGHLGLDNLIVIYDDNHITIDGDTELSFTEDVVKRYKAYGWNVIEVPGDGNDMAAFEKALKRARRSKGKPSIIKIRSHIAFGAPTMQDTEKAHGSPLGDDEIRQMKTNFGWDPEQTFHVPDDVRDHMDKIKAKGKRAENKWKRQFKKYTEAHPDLAAQFEAFEQWALPENIDDLLPSFDPEKGVATRKASGKTLDALMPHVGWVMGGSADLTPSNNTRFADARDFQKENFLGRYLRFGVREHAMGAILNGISVSGMVRGYGGTFFVFSDYMRPAIRVAALSKYPTIFVFTHDSIGLGEDGPTHQPIEHLPSLRAMPNLILIRPADANETAQAWKFALGHKDGPVALLLTRQGLPVLDQTQYPSAANLTKGAYVLVEQDNPDVILIASGSEVSLALCAAEGLAADGIKAQVVSMPSWELFEMQDQAYKDSVLPPQTKARVAVEAAIGQGWEKYVGQTGAIVALVEFGASAPYKDCYANFGITTDAVITAAKQQLAQ